jgi:hypothetical protein
MKTNLTQQTSKKKAGECKKLQVPMSELQHIEKQEFDLGLAPDDAYVKYDFLKGDVVVYMDHISFDDLQTVDAFQPNEYYWLENGQLVHRADIRSATLTELKAKHRLDPPTALFVSG